MSSDHQLGMTGRAALCAPVDLLQARGWGAGLWNQMGQMGEWAFLVMDRLRSGEKLEKPETVSAHNALRQHTQRIRRG